MRADSLLHWTTLITAKMQNAGKHALVIWVCDCLKIIFEISVLQGLFPLKDPLSLLQRGY